MPDHEDSVRASSGAVVSNEGLGPETNRLSRFIARNVEQIVVEWESFARGLTPSSSGMTPLALRDHIRQILSFVIPDMERDQTAEQQKAKSHGGNDGTDTAAQTHAALRFAGGFDIGQMASEYRALRASILRLWSRTNPAFDSQDIGDIMRFNESIDQELAESVSIYTKKVAQSNDLVIAILGHDLRGPVQAIMLSAELALRMGGLSDRQRMLSENVLESAVRMGALITTVLDVTRSRFNAGLPAVRVMMDMGFVAQQVVDEVRIVHAKRTIELSLSGTLVGEWDRPRVGQVFSNLVSNAVQYGFHDSPIRVHVDGRPDAVVLAVRNQGKPIPPDRMVLIFNPLTRGAPDDQTPSSSGNLGLGLFIAREVVVAHGGTIGVTSSEMDGTTFTAVFPRLEPPSAH